jgi:hypothetical protein
LHPSLRIALYVFAALALPGLSFLGLVISAGLSLLLFHKHLAGARRLIWRARWLFLLLGVGYAYSLPGPAGIPVLAEYSPSLPGLWLGAKQMLRLFLLLWLLDGLVISMGENRLMAGLYGVFSVGRMVGFPVERTTVRLGLTLEVMEGNIGKRHGLREALANLNAPVSGSTHFTIQSSPWRAMDSVILIVSLAALVMVWRG